MVFRDLRLARLIAFVAILLAVGAGSFCLLRSFRASDGESRMPPRSEGPSREARAFASGLRLVFAEDSVSTGKNIIRFKLLSKEGRELAPDDMDVSQEKLLHLVLVRDDLSWFRHFHPEYKDGMWEVGVDLDSTGWYLAYADVVPKGEGNVVLKNAISADGVARPTTNPPKPTPGLRARDGEYSATLRLSTEAKAGGEAVLTFQLKKGNASADVHPYLGAYGHVVILRHDDAEEYVHAHPVEGQEPKNGVVEFEAEIQKPGRYTAFAQFDLGGGIRTFPITFEIAGNAATTTSAGTAGHGHP